MSKNHQQKEPVKQTEQPAAAEEVQKTTPLEQAIEQDQGKSTVQVLTGTKSALDELKTKLGTDYNGAIAHLLAKAQKEQSNEDAVHLTMNRQKFTWLLAFQTNGDCSRFLKASVD